MEETSGHMPKEEEQHAYLQRAAVKEPSVWNEVLELRALFLNQEQELAMAQPPSSTHVGTRFGGGFVEFIPLPTPWVPNTSNFATTVFVSAIGILLISAAPPFCARPHLANGQPQHVGSTREPHHFWPPPSSKVTTFPPSYQWDGPTIFGSGVPTPPLLMFLSVPLTPLLLPNTLAWLIQTHHHLWVVKRRFKIVAKPKCWILKACKGLMIFLLPCKI